MMRARHRVVAAAVLLVTAQVTACSTCQGLTPVSISTPTASPPTAPPWRQAAPASVPPPPAPFLAAVPAPTFPGTMALGVPGRTGLAGSPRILSGKLTHTLDGFLVRYGGGRTAVSVRDLTTGRRYRYHRALQLPTASISKVSILTALLLDTRWRELGDQARSDARHMIRFGDDGAADRLYERIGLESGLASANRRLGLKRTYTPGGRCVAQNCWGATQSTAEDQVRLVRALATGRSPLAPAERRRVLGLMERVTPGQKWGISAGACENDQVSLKNGWLRHASNGRWVVVSAGLIRGHGHDYAVAVLTEDSPSMSAGIAKVEGVAARVMKAFRGEHGCEPDAN
ncbi:serine hydrolase [Streptosporangium sp. NPDC001681]|uniref:serine hydrolase n=1 Tax=Streptosporangium sp. NPDC001681 TaxID=3154395 RepID=UPI003322A1AE